MGNSISSAQACSFFSNENEPQKNIIHWLYPILTSKVLVHLRNKIAYCHLLDYVVNRFQVFPLGFSRSKKFQRSITLWFVFDPSYIFPFHPVKEDGQHSILGLNVVSSSKLVNFVIYISSPNSDAVCLSIPTFSHYIFTMDTWESKENKESVHKFLSQFFQPYRNMLWIK